MATISVSLPSDGSTADVADYNTPITTIVNAINGNLDNANIVSSAAISTSKLADDAGITTAKLADDAITPAKLTSGTGSSWAWQTWTPTWTNLTAGNATITAKYIQDGKTVHYRLAVVFGNTTSIGGAVSFSLPVTSASYAGTSTLPPIGQVQLYDSSSGNLYNGVSAWVNTTTARVRWFVVSGTAISASDLANTVPFGAAWATSDEIVIQGTYEAT